MKSIFEERTREEITKRIDSLNNNSNPLWGKMTVAQMVKHCTLCEEYYLGEVRVNRSFLGRIFGKMAIKAMLKDEKSSLRKNSPTSPVFKVTESNYDLDTEKQKWKSLLERYSTFSNQDFKHWFFGNMTRTQLGQFIYKHTDHHLKQFGV